MKFSHKMSMAAALFAASAWTAVAAADADAIGPEASPGLLIEAGYTGDLWRNARGGLEVGNAYLDNLDLLATLDGAQRLGIDGLTLHAHVMYNNGHAFSGRWVGDAQGVSNIEGVDTWRLYEFWSEFSFGPRRGTSLRAGLYDLNSEFDSIDTAGLFLGSSHGIGPEISQTGLNGPSIFPVTSLGLRMKGEAVGGYWQLVALDAVPGQRLHPEHTGFQLGGAEGALFVGELGTAKGRFSKLAVGAWSYTADFEAIGETDVSGDPLKANGNRGIYGMAELRLVDTDALHVSGWLRTGVAAQRFNAFSSYVGLGIAAGGLVPGRPDDQIGFAIASVEAGSRWRQQQALAGSASAARETALELTWRLPVNDWLTLQPDLQYVINPGASAELRDALTLGVRFELATTWSR